VTVDTKRPPPTSWTNLREREGADIVHAHLCPDASTGPEVSGADDEDDASDDVS
jgi:hypothetical protein